MPSESPHGPRGDICGLQPLGAGGFVSKKRLKNRGGIPIIRLSAPSVMTLPPPSPAVASPCIKVCVLDAQQVCVGCGRTLEEIAQWSGMSEEQRGQVVDRARQRRSQAAP